MITFTFHLLTVACVILLVASGETVMHVRKRLDAPRVAREIRDAATRVMLESRRTQHREFLTDEDVRFLEDNGWRPDTSLAQKQLPPAPAKTGTHTPPPLSPEPVDWDDLALDGEIISPPQRPSAYKDSIRREASRTIIEGKITRGPRPTKGHPYYCSCAKCGGYGYLK